jgi:hypothetical protein
MEIRTPKARQKWVGFPEFTNRHFCKVLFPFKPSHTLTLFAFPISSYYRVLRLIGEEFEWSYNTKHGAWSFISGISPWGPVSTGVVYMCDNQRYAPCAVRCAFLK